MSKDNRLELDIGANKRLVVREYRGVTLIDIREYYEKEGKALPGKKGISIKAAQWRAIMANAKLVERAIAGEPLIDEDDVQESTPEDAKDYDHDQDETSSHNGSGALSQDGRADPAGASTPKRAKQGSERSYKIKSEEFVADEDAALD